MQSPTYRRDHSYISLGERRGKSDLARFSLDLSWAREVSDSARSRAYPSPPMSGSPPLPPRRNPDSSDRGHGGYGSIGQDVFRGNQTPQSEHSEQSRGPPLPVYQRDQHPAAPYPPYRIEDPSAAPPQYPPQHRAYQAPPPPPPAPFSTPDRSTIRESFEYSSPKAQRKTKGHVASACVPCKKAHLRCDAQRPCSRCLGNGKEDACVDVQHKKRGRPRLRDEKETRFDSLASSYPPPSSSSMRRPLYSPGDVSLSTPFAEPLHRTGSYRVLKSHGGSSGQSTARFLERASPRDANIYGGPIPQAPRMLAQQEPACAYLTMDMQIVKATQSFGETVGVQSVVARKFHETVSASDREKVFRLQRAFEDERREREPNYLPPIYLKFEEDRVIQSVGFGSDELSLFRMDRQEVLTFHGPDGQQRTFQVHFGLAKKESTYFIALILHIPAATPQTFQQPISSPYSFPRDSQYGYQTQQPYSQNPTGPTFVPNAPYPGVEATHYRASGPRGSMIPSAPTITPFGQPQPSADYAPGQNPYQTPRSELAQAQPARHHDLQLPPIRGQRGDVPSGDPSRRREDRTGRVDIGGLLEESDPGRKRS